MKNKGKAAAFALALVFIVAGCASCGVRREPLENMEISETSEADLGTESLEAWNNEAPEEETETGVILDAEANAEIEIEERLKEMSLEEKVAQLFIITPEALAGESGVTEASETMRDAFAQYPVGGFVYFEKNLSSKEQVKTMLSNIQTYSMDCAGLPAFACVDEEGGSVARISGTGKFDVPDIENMSEIGKTGDAEAAYGIGCKIGEYLHELGFNVDFAPVADVLSNPQNTVVKSRSFGSDSDLVSDLSTAVCEGLLEHGVYPVLKHFPGHGATEADSHEGYAYTGKSLEELQACELVPFQRGIDTGVSFIMAGHISAPNVTGDDVPASLSEIMINGILREQMGFDGVVVTDAMNMGAVARNYSSSEAAVLALSAGADIVLMPQDFFAAYQGVLDAVKEGVLPEGRIDAAVRRVLAVKMRLKEGDSHGL